MKIIFYGRHQIGQVVLLYLLTKGYTVKLLTPEDSYITQIGTYYSLEMVDLDNLGEFDLFICCHGKKIIPAKYLATGKFINMHPCLQKYPGKDPISRYMYNGDKIASVSSHYMAEEVDNGEEIYTSYFTTPLILFREQFYMFALPIYLEVIHETMKRLCQE